MSFKALFYAYVLGGLTFLPLVAFGFIFFTLYTSVPVGDPDPLKGKRNELENAHSFDEEEEKEKEEPCDLVVDDVPRRRKSWLTMRRTFEETESDGSYVSLVRGFLDARSNDPKRARPKDMWLAVLKGSVLYLYEDEEMTECEAVLDMAAHDVVVYPEGQLDGELFTKRNAIALRPRAPPSDDNLPSITKEMKLGEKSVDEQTEAKGGNSSKKDLTEAAKKRESARAQAADVRTPWFIFFRNNVEMEDWYHALIHASDFPNGKATLKPLEPVFLPEDMARLVSTLDDQPDIIPTRWLNALLGRIFFSFYRSKVLEAEIIARLMKKLAKVKRPTFLSDIVVREVNVGTRPPMISRPMLKELTKEGDASIELHLHYKGELRITVEATATINLGARFKSYPVKLVLAAILREIEGNMLVKVKRPPTNRIWYAFTQPPKMDLVVEPIVSDRQITWSLITSTIESKMKEIILESVVLPNMDDIAFYNSKTKEHRGGIWADSCRQPYTEEEGTDARDGTGALSPELITPPSEHILPLERDSTIDSASFHSARSTSVGSEVAGAQSTASSPNLSTKSTTSARRRTWLSGSQEIPVIDSPVPVEGEDTRGRSTAADSSAAPRSKSTPVGPRVEELSAQSQTSSSSSLLTPTDSRHSPSPTQDSHSSSIHQEDSHDDDDLHNALDDYDPPSSAGLSTSAPSTPSLSRTNSASSSRASAGASSSAASQASNFLNQLKARAAATDKQALGAQAKETMRKWGATWAKLRREPGANDEQEADEPDAGEREPARAITSRTTFADVRAKVEERRASRNDDPARGTSPVPIPGAASRSVSANGSEGARTAFPSTSPGEALRTAVAPSSPTPPPRNTQPPRPKTMSIPGIHASHRGEVMSMGYTPIAPEPSAPVPSDKASVYSRLWKTSMSNNASPSASSPSSAAAELNMDANIPTSNGEITPTPTPNPDSSTSTPLFVPAPSTNSPKPPPLPPRAMHAPRASNGGSESPALAALDRIRNRDDEVRHNVAPPLPPRKKVDV